MTRVTTLAACALAAASAWAGPSDEPLEPEQAFPLEARVGQDGIDLSFGIAPGYYLYRDRFRLEVDPGLPVGSPALPAGEARDDPFVGPTRVLHGLATLRLPFTGSARAGTYRIQVTAQGCASGRVCYAPFSQVVRVSVPPAP